MTLILDPQHGVNPSMLQCFYCMKDFGVALLGKQGAKIRKALADSGTDPGYGDERQAPRRVCLDRRPCPECEGYMERGIILISARDSDADEDNPYRTGAWVVVSEDFIRRVLSPEMAALLLEKRFSFVQDTAWDGLTLPRPPLPESETNEPTATAATESE